jgi:hypothetical protein
VVRAALDMTASEWELRLSMESKQYKTEKPTPLQQKLPGRICDASMHAPLGFKVFART